jgi:N-acetylglucosaminyldiphosphoundecaprenol N-acetyl-beta-D-mannosaminyltransferase
MQKQTAIAKPSQAQFNTVTLYDIPLLAATEKQCVQHIMARLESGCGGWCVTVNLDILRQITFNARTRSLVRDSSLFTADGISLVWASKLRGTPLPARVCGCDLIYSLTEEVARRDRSIFLLGGNPGTDREAAEILKQSYKGLTVAGTYSPPFDFESDPKQIEVIVDAIASTQPDIIYVALGFPKQEKLIAKIRHVCPNAWWMGVGISFSYVCGEFKRAPVWIQKSGLETFYRVTLEPKRLAKRYLLVCPPFVILLLVSSWLERFGMGDRIHSLLHKFSQWSQRKYEE